MKQTWLRLLKFSFPILLWLYLFRNFLTGVTPITGEPFAVVAMVKFYLDHLCTGVIPLWNPFVQLGFPLQIILNYFGSSNPIWLLTLILNVMGLSFYFAFVWTIMIYFLLGQIGFYWLAKAVLKDRGAAYIAFLLSLFSSAGLIEISQFNILLIYVPAVWFFYFLVRFYQRKSVSSWIGMTFTLMIIFCAYLPFYFLTVLGLVILIFILINWHGSWAFIVELFRFCRAHSRIVILSFVVLVTSAIPILLAYQSTVIHEVVFPCRQEGEGIFTRGAALSSYKSATDGGLSRRMSFDELFFNLDQLIYGNEGFFCVSGLAYLISLLGAFNKINRRIVFFMLLGAGIFVLVMSNATPIYQFLFEHIVFFRLFRNIHFLLPFLLAAFILLTAEQARLILTWKKEVFGQGLVKYIAPVFLFLCIVIQPLIVIEGHNQLAPRDVYASIKDAMIKKRAKPQFSFVRDTKAISGTPEELIQVFYNYYLSMKDTPVDFMKNNHGFPTYWSFYLFKNFPF